MNKIIFFDINWRIVETMQQYINYPNAVFIAADVSQVIRDHDVDILISPANCMGYMDGGIDGKYSKMFPEIERKVRNEISLYDIKSTMPEIFDHNVIPIGSAILIDIESYTDVKLKRQKPRQLMCCPTMEYPRDISDTPEIIYFAMCAILNLASKNHNKVIAIPGLGTSTGKISAREMCKQVNKAISEFQDIETRYKQYILRNQDTAFVVDRDLYLVKN